MRLWSTVVSQLDSRPRETTIETGGRSALAATGTTDLEARVQVGDQRVDLELRPVVPHGGHLADAGPEDARQPRLVAEQRVRRDVRADRALAGEAVALRANPDEGLLAERLLVGLPLLDERGVPGGGEHLHLREHLGVEQPAELGALAAEGAELRREPRRLVGMARDRVELATERRHPPAVVDVVRDDPQAHRLVVRQPQVIDRDGAVRVRELPVVLVAVDPDDLPRRSARRRAGGGADVGDLPEDEAGDDREDHDGPRGPGELEVRVPADLR